MPETSIVIRTYNEDKHIGNLLRAIEKQNYKNYEIIVVDSGSTDKTLDIVKEFPVKIVSIDSKDFTFGYSLNIGCKESRGRHLVFASAHVLPLDEKWLSSLIAPFNNEKIANVFGRQTGHPTSKFSETMDFKRIFGTTPLDSNIPLDYVNNANAAMRKELWEKRPFDEYLFGLEDVDWAKYITSKGYLIRYEPKAAVYHIHHEAWHQVFNRFRREAIAAVRIGLKHSPQARTGFVRAALNFLRDCISSFPNWSLSRLEEIARFRYYQCKGTRQGWYRDRDLDLNRDKQEIFSSEANQVVLIENKHKANLTKISLPEMKPGDILIRVEYVGVCRTDLEVYGGTLNYYRDGLANYPIVPGHEFSGTIVKIGANNKYRERFRVGDRVVGECILSRGENGHRKEVGVINHNGAYAEFVMMPGNAIHKVPEHIDLKTATLTEPLGVVLRALRRIRGRLFSDALIAVVGAGPLGNLCAQVLSLEGYKVSVYDKNDKRLKLLENKVDKTSTDLRDLNNFDVIIEITGSQEVLEQVLKESHMDSTILLLGFPYGGINYNFEDVVGKDKFILGSVGAEWEDFPKALELLPRLDTSYFTDTILPLTDFKKAWSLQNSAKYLKILLKP